MNDSSDDGLCDGDSSSKKDSNLNFQKRRPAFFEGIQNSSKRVQVWSL